VNGTGQHVTVFGVIAAVNNPVFMASHHRFWKLAAQLALKAVGSSLFPAQFANLSSAGFSEDLVAPNRKVKARLLRQEQQQIRHAVVGEHARIQHDLEIGSHRVCAYAMSATGKYFPA
jgi:hypothetical protein